MPVAVLEEELARDYALLHAKGKFAGVSRATKVILNGPFRPCPAAH